MPERITRKWRPPLALVIGGTLAGVLGVPLVGIGYFRVAGNVLGWAETAWLIAWMAILSTAILGFLLWRLVLRPVYALTDYSRALKAGRVDAVPPSHFGTPEFSELGQSVTDMAETLHNRATGLRAYAGHVTHELKSPLTAIRGAAELLETEVSEADRADLAKTISVAAERMERLLEDLRAHANARRQGAHGVCLLSDITLHVDGIELRVGEDDTVPMPAEDLHAALTQLAQNAVAHGADVIEVSMSGGSLSVLDNGRGIAAGNRERVFDPFFTPRRAEGGTGMGLSIARALVEAHGGQIIIVPAEAGAWFEISF